jgi:hypothetical protein
VSSGREEPFKYDWIHAGSKSGVGALEDEKCRHRIHGNFKASVEKTGAVGSGEYPSITNSRVPNVRVLRAAGDGVSASCPNLKFAAAILGTILSLRWIKCET